jgi:hypothetical protein
MWATLARSGAILACLLGALRPGWGQNPSLPERAPTISAERRAQLLRLLRAKNVEPRVAEELALHTGHQPAVRKALLAAYIRQAKRPGLISLSTSRPQCLTGW